MKTLATVIYCLLVPSFLFAQIQITSNDIANTFAPGKAWQQETSPDTITMNVGNASGSSQTWTVPANIFSDTTLRINISPANTPYASIFPTATHVQYSNNIDFGGNGNKAAVYEYLRITPDTMWTLGTVSHVTGPGLDTIYIERVNYISAIFPLHYGEKFVEGHDSLNFGFGSYMITTLNVHYDAFGTITFPNGTFNALRETLVSKTDTYVNGSLSNSTKTHTISWLTKADGNFNAYIDTSSQISGDVSIYQPLLNLVESYPTAVDESTSNIPEKCELFQNYPTPFNPSTTIQYQIPQSALVIIKVYDVLGKEVKTLVNQYQNMGSHEVNFNSGNLSSGVYFYQLIAGNFLSTKKMTLLK
ncbi:MAG: T9SS type A sorting domain-containing protein [Ignavibacteriaceae bacterium]